MTATVTQPIGSSPHRPDCFPVDGRLIVVARRDQHGAATALTMNSAQDFPAMAVARQALMTEGWTAVAAPRRWHLPSRELLPAIVAESARVAATPGGATCGHRLLPGEFALTSPGSRTSPPVQDCVKCADWPLYESSDCYLSGDPVDAVTVFARGSAVILIHLCHDCLTNELLDDPDELRWCALS